MNAVYFKEHGGAEKLQFGPVSDPKPLENEVLIEIRFAALNHVDLWIRKGIPAYPVQLPHIMGSDGAGVVKALGPDAEGVSLGDRVVIISSISCGICGACKAGKDNQCENFDLIGGRRQGTYGEMVTVPDNNVIPLPDHISFEEAAAFPVAYLTAWHMLIGRAHLQKDESILIVGAGSGIGAAAIQIAKWKSARIFALTSHQNKIDRLNKLGAEEVVVASNESDFSEKIRSLTNGKGVDVVAEHVGPATWNRSVRSLAPTGRLVTCGATTGPTVSVDLRYLFSRDLSILGAKNGTKKEFIDLSEVVFQGKIRPVIDKIFPAREAVQAHEYLESKKHIGKILLQHG